MAIDQAILESTAETGKPTLRFYRWSPATLSLGYFQKLDDRMSHQASLSCPIIRRASGGGAIVHDDELTYSICISTKGAIAKANTGRYDTVHLAFQSGLAEQGIAVELYRASKDAPVKASKDDPFLCFQRRAVGDIICADAKVGGSAQRRLKNALIQHGSILLSRSEFAPELPGLKEQSGIEVDVARLHEHVAGTLSRSLDLQFKADQMTPEELARAQNIASEKFGSEAWLGKR